MRNSLAIFALVLLSWCLAVHGQTCTAADPQVLILGGGMAGLAAANRLQELGITDFMILESQSRLGGRVRTEPVEINELTVNLNVGASWIQGVDPEQPRLQPLFDLAERCGGLQGIYSDFNDLEVYNSTGQNVTESLRFDDYDQATEEINVDDNRDITSTVRQALESAGWNASSPEDNFVDWFEFDFCFAKLPENSSLLRTFNVPTFTDFLASPNNEARDYFITDKRGMPFLTDCLANNISTHPNNDPRIHLNSNVTQIEYSDDCVCATAMEEGQSVQYCAPYAVVTFSIGVLKQMMFEPSLSTKKTNALRFLVMADFKTLYALYDDSVAPFWDNVEFIGHAHPDRGYFPLIQPLDQDLGINGLAFTLTDAMARRIAQEDEDTIKRELTEVLRAIYSDQSIPEPAKIVFKDWSSDTSFLGSFTHVLPGGTIEDAEALLEPEGGMYLAGEGISIEYVAFMHGAYLSGIETAERIAQNSSPIISPTLPLLALPLVLAWVTSQ